jgi:hypothetical protein
VKRHTYYALFECGKRITKWLPTEAAVMKEAYNQYAVIKSRSTGDVLASGYEIKRGVQQCT